MRNEVYFTKSTKYSSQNPVLSRFVLFSLVMTFFSLNVQTTLQYKEGSEASRYSIFFFTLPN